MELWLVRHGSTRANIEGRLQGRKDYPLSRQGEEEALCLAARLRREKYSVVFCSDQTRARQTARLIISGLEIRPFVIYSSILREYDWGLVQGLTSEEIRQRYPVIWDRLKEDFHHAYIPGAEGWKNIWRRAGKFYRTLQAINKKKGFSSPFLVVGHGRFLQALIIYVLKYDPANYWPFSLSPASLTILESISCSRSRLKLFNDTCHLSKI